MNDEIDGEKVELVLEWVEKHGDRSRDGRED